MTMTEMLRVYEALRKLYPADPPPPDRLRIAYRAEMGEFFQSWKYGFHSDDLAVRLNEGWAWWDNGKPRTPARKREVLEELADAWHFALALALAREPGGALPAYYDLAYDLAWSAPDAGAPHFLQQQELFEPVFEARSLGLSRLEFEDAFLRKALINARRQGGSLDLTGILGYPPGVRACPHCGDVDRPRHDGGFAWCAACEGVDSYVR